MKDLRIGFALCGSFCTIGSALKQMRQLKASGAEIFPIVSDALNSTDTRFGNAKDIITEIENITGKMVMNSIVTAEPIGPQAMLDILVVAPCTGNTLAKIANSVTDTAVTMAVKAHLRNKKPVVIAISSNDALGNSARNLGTLLNTKNIYFVPFGQDDPARKANSLISDLSLLESAIEKALAGEQLQPILL